MTVAPSLRTSSTALYRCSTRPSSTSTMTPSFASNVLVQSEEGLDPPVADGVSPIYRSQGVAHVPEQHPGKCRPSATGARVSCIYRDFTSQLIFVIVLVELGLVEQRYGVGRQAVHSWLRS